MQEWRSGFSAVQKSSNCRIKAFDMVNRQTVKEFLFITFGTAVIAAAVYFFMLPSHVTV